MFETGEPFSKSKRTTRVLSQTTASRPSSTVYDSEPKGLLRVDSSPLSPFSAVARLLQTGRTIEGRLWPPRAECVKTRWEIPYSRAARQFSRFFSRCEAIGLEI
jgi:hypothetical protein